jgi:hypothetical protein
MKPFFRVNHAVHTNHMIQCSFEHASQPLVTFDVFNELIYLYEEGIKE